MSSTRSGMSSWAVRRPRPHDAIYAEGMQIAKQGGSRFPHPAWQDHLRQQVFKILLRPASSSNGKADEEMDMRLRQMLDAAAPPDQSHAIWQLPFQITAGAKQALRRGMLLSKQARERDSNAEIRGQNDAHLVPNRPQPLSLYLTDRELEQLSARVSRLRRVIPSSYADLVNPESRLCCLRRVRNTAIIDHPIDADQALGLRFDLSSSERDGFAAAKRHWIGSLKRSYQLFDVPLDLRPVWDKWNSEVRRQMQAFPRPCTPPLIPPDQDEPPMPASYAEIGDLLILFSFEPEAIHDSCADDPQPALAATVRLVRGVADPCAATALHSFGGRPFGRLAPGMNMDHPFSGFRKRSKSSTEHYHSIQKQLRRESQAWMDSEPYGLIQSDDTCIDECVNFGLRPPLRGNLKRRHFVESLHRSQQDVDEENEVSNSEVLRVQTNSSSGDESPWFADETVSLSRSTHFGRPSQDPLYRNRLRAGSRLSSRSPLYANGPYGGIVTACSPQSSQAFAEPRTNEDDHMATVPARRPRPDLEMSTPLRRVILHKTRNTGDARAECADVQVTDPRLLVLAASQRILSPVHQAQRPSTPPLPTWLEDPAVLNPPWYQSLAGQDARPASPPKVALMQVGLLANPPLLRALSSNGIRLCERDSLQGVDLALSPTVGVIFCKFARLQYDMSAIKSSIEEATGYYTRVLLVVEAVAFGELERDPELLRYVESPLTPNTITFLTRLTDMIRQYEEDGVAGFVELIFACRGALEVTRVLCLLSADQQTLHGPTDPSEDAVTSDEQVLTDIYGLNTFAALCLLQKAGSLSAYADLDEDSRIAEFGGILGIEVAERLSAIVAGDARKAQTTHGPKRRKRDTIKR